MKINKDTNLVELSNFNAVAQKQLTEMMRDFKKSSLEDIEKRNEDRDPRDQMDDSQKKQYKKTVELFDKLIKIVSKGFEENRKAFESSIDVAIHNGLSRTEYGELIQTVSKNTDSTERLIFSNAELINSVKQLSKSFGLSSSGLGTLASTDAAIQKMLGDSYNQNSYAALLRANGTDFDLTKQQMQSYAANLKNTELQFKEIYGKSEYISSGTYNVNQQILSRLEAISKSSDKTSLTLSNEIQTLVGGIYEKVGKDVTGYNEQISNLLNGKFGNINVGMWQALSQSGVNISNILQGNVTDSEISTISKNYLSNFLNTYNDQNAWALVGALGYSDYDFYTKGQLAGTSVNSLLEQSTSIEEKSYDELKEMTASTKSIREMISNLYTNSIGGSEIGKLSNVWGNDFSLLTSFAGTLFGSSLGEILGKTMPYLKSGGTKDISKGIIKGGARLGLGAAGLGFAIDDATSINEGIYSDNELANSVGGFFLGQGYDSNNVLGSLGNTAKNIGKYTAIGASLGGGPGAAIGAVLGIVATGVGAAIQSYREGIDAKDDSRANIQERVDAFGADIVIKNTEVSTADMNDNILTIADILREIASNTADKATTIA